MPNALISVFEKESQFQHISVNTLVNNIIYGYIEWERYAEKFGFTGLSRETFQVIISHFDEAELTALASAVSSAILKELTFYSGEISGFKIFLDFVQNFPCTHALVNWKCVRMVHSTGLVFCTGWDIRFHTISVNSTVIC